MKINWKVRLCSKKFWLFLVPVVVSFVVQEGQIFFGVNLDTTQLTTWLTGIVTFAFAVLNFLGITADPTTDGLGDSDKALANKPNTKSQQIADLQTQLNELKSSNFASEDTTSGTTAAINPTTEVTKNE